MQISQKPHIRPPTNHFPLIKSTIKNLGLTTVCQESRCPNLSECWSEGTATFMVMGDTCTRACKFCHVKTLYKGQPLDPQEPAKLAQAAREWGLDYLVLTSVDRDDLPDQGAAHLARCIQALKQIGLQVEALIPDFQGNIDALKTVLKAKPDVLAHNIETVKRLQSSVRDPRAGYEQSLEVLRQAKALGVPRTKSSLMLGLGETCQEVIQTMHDLRANHVDIFTLGQYLKPSSRHLTVKQWITQEEWDFYQMMGEELGFATASGPLVRSSYKAKQLARGQSF